MELTKDISKLSTEEYNKVIDLAKEVTEFINKLFIKDNTTSVQIAEFAFSLGGLIFFKHVVDVLNIEDPNLAAESLSNTILEINKQLESKKDKEVN